MTQSPFLEALGIGGKSVEVSTWLRPRSVRLADGWLVPEGRGDRAKVGAHQAGLLAQFARLADADEQHILDFASKWGMLNLCEHGMPGTHSSGVVAELASDPWTTCSPMVAGDPPLVGEPTELWRQYAGQAGAFLDLADRVKRGLSTTMSDWDPLRSLFPHFVLPDDRNSEHLRRVTTLPERGVIGEIRVVIPQMKEARLALAYGIRKWLRMAAVDVQFDWRGPEPTLTFGGRSLFGALATMLAVGLSGSEGLLLCSHCRLPYSPARRPRGPRHFCADCREDGVPQRYASQDYRRRKRETASSPISTLDLPAHGKV